MKGTRATAGLSRRARAIEVSPTVAVSQKAAALKAQGHAVLNFSVGEPDQPTPEHVSAAAIRALHDGFTRYTQAAGLPELRAAIAERYEKDFGIHFEPADVVATSGGKHGLYTVCQALINPGDEVIIPTPYWPTFSETVRLAGGKPVFVHTREEDGFRVTASLIRKALTPRTRAVIINTPSNPTGAVIAPGELRAIGRLSKRHGFTLIYDDTYGYLIFEEADHSPLPELRRSIPDQFVILGTASKTYCMTGWRVGWLLGPRALMQACTALNSHSTQCPAAFAQLGAVEALTGPQGFVRSLCAEYRTRRNIVHKALSAIPGVVCNKPQGSFYVFPRLQAFLGGELKNTLQLAERLLDEERLAVVPGEGFGRPGYARISFARSRAELAEGLARLGGFLERHRHDGSHRR